MKSLVNYFIDRSFAVNLICLAVCAIGIASLTSIKRNLIPKVPSYQISISASFPGASPSSVEKDITFPIEQALAGLPEIEEIDSTSSQGSMYVNIQLKRSNEPIDKSLETIKSKVESVKAQLPKNISDLETKIVKRDVSSILGFGLLGFDDKRDEHYQTLDRVKDELLNVIGVVSVSSYEPKRGLYLEIDPNALTKHRLRQSQVVNKLVEYLSPSTINVFRKKGKQIIVDFAKEPLDIDLLEEVPIYSNRFHQSIKLGDIANISYRKDEFARTNPYNGKPGVFVQANMSIDDDVIKIGQAVVQKIEEVKSSLPEDLSIEILYNSSKFVGKQLEVLNSNAMLGFVTVVILLGFFVGLKPALTTAMGLPVTYLGTIAVIHYIGIQINIISVMAMIIIVGILVDDAIIVAEKYIANLESGMKKGPAAQNAALSLMAPITGTILTTVVAFSPILLVDGTMKDWFYSVPVIIIVALTLSWLECFFILPNHLKHFVHSSKNALGEKVLSFITNTYRSALKTCLRFRWLSFLLVVALTGVASYFIAGRMNVSFDMNIGQKRILVVTELASSENVDDTLRQIKPVQDFLISLKESEDLDVMTSPGSAFIGGNREEGPRFAEFQIYSFNLDEDQKVVYKRVTDKIRKGLKQFETDTKFQKIQLLERSSQSDDVIQNSVTVFVTGKDQLDAQQIRGILKEKLKNLPGMDDIYFDENDVSKNWKFHPNLDVMASYGITKADISSQISGLFAPVPVGYGRYNGEQVRIYSQFSSTDPKYKQLSKLMIQSPAKTLVPITNLGYWSLDKAPKELTHRDGKRDFAINISYNPNKTDLRKFTSSVAAKLAPLNEEYSQYTWSVESSDRNQEKAQDWIIKVIMMSLVAIILILALTLESVGQSFLVMLPIPFGFLGALWAFYLHDIELSLIGLVGLVGVAGVAVNDSIIMVYAINQLSKTGSQSQAILDGAVSRLRAIFLTTITTLGGVFPMAYSIGGESGYTKGIAFAMGWGLLSSTIATLVVIPITVQLREDIMGSFIGRAIGFLLSSKAKKSKAEPEERAHEAEQLAPITE